MSINTYTPVIANSPTLEQLVGFAPLIPFDQVSLDFVGAFSDRLLRRPEAKIYPELMALAFWMRKSHLKKWRQDYVPEDRFFQARGTVFHIAPSNVDTIFVYSWFLSLICGNKNIVRVPSQERAVTNAILTIMEELFGSADFEPIRDRTLLVRYGREQAINGLFSSACDLRVIWGGDETILNIRQAALPPTAIEMTFADKFSLALLSVEVIEYLEEPRLRTAAEAFYNDSVWFGQKACSSPRMVVWLAARERSPFWARQRWWEMVEKIAAEKGLSWETADYINKRVVADQLAMQTVGVSIASSPFFTRIWLDRPFFQSDLHCGAGLFHECGIQSLEELGSLVNRKIQTVIYYGVEEQDWQHLLREKALLGIDRVVPLGHALDFHPVWDGFDLPRMLLREVQFSIHIN